MEKTKQIDVWMVSQISVFLEQSIDTVQGNSAYWMMDDGSQLELDFDMNQVKFVDWAGDTKTYFAIIGLANSREMEVGDYFTKL
jgi:hypothetical protein